MEAIGTQTYIPFSSLTAVLLPDEDLELMFSLRDIIRQNLNNCGTNVIHICSEAGVTDEIENATLVWRNCGVTWSYDANPIDIVSVDGKVVSIKFIIFDYHLSNVNDFEIFVTSNGNLTRIGRGRVYLDISSQVNNEVIPDPIPSDGVDEDAFVINEIPLGVIDGMNATFTTEFPFVPESVQVVVNGIIQSQPDDFSTTGNQQINLGFSLDVGEELAVTYIKL